MALFIELLVILILMLIWFSISREQSKAEKGSIPKATIKEFWEGLERRKSFRLHTSLKVTYIVEKKAHLKLNGKSKNISPGGLMLEIEEKLYPNIPLKLEITIPDDRQPIFTEAEVIWVEELKDPNQNEKRRFDIGVKFLNLSITDHDRLLNFIETERRGGKNYER